MRINHETRMTDYDKLHAIMADQGITHELLCTSDSQWGEWALPKRATRGIVVGDLLFVYYAGGTFMGWVESEAQIFVRKERRR